MSATNTAPQTAKEHLAGVFRLCLDLSNADVGGPNLSLQLLVNPMNEQITGLAVFTEPLIGQQAIRSKIEGHYGIIVDGASERIVISFTGYPDVHWPKNGGVGPVLLPNLKGQVILNGGFDGNGVGNYAYQNPKTGQWTPVRNQPANNEKC